MKKRVNYVLCLFAVAVLLLVPKQVKAAYYKSGSDIQMNAPEISLGNVYYRETYTDDMKKFYRFKTGNLDGVYLISFRTAIEGGQGGSARAAAYSTLTVMDGYTNKVAGIDGKSGRMSIFEGYSLNDKKALMLDAVIVASNLNRNTDYYIQFGAYDGLKSWNYNKVSSICVEFVPFRVASGFAMAENSNGDLTFTWNNIEKYNSYNSLASFDKFIIKAYANGNEKNIAEGNGGVNCLIVKGNNSTLRGFGYPENTVNFELFCGQTYYSYFNSRASFTKMYSTGNILFTSPLTRSSEHVVNGIKYRIRKNGSNGCGEVEAVGTDQTFNSGNLHIPESVVIKGYNFSVTSIADDAFAGNKSITTVTIGKNVKKIGSRAFSGCSSLKKVRIKSKNLKKVGKKAFFTTNKKGKIKVPSSKLTGYKRLLKGKITKGIKIMK
ncbi:Leucine rich repeat-containing protein [Butyrivibrio sp. ob235]|uniref:leucine-rich repeat protein n=1 Tax=Butyrivibrio sp. ob235 TaxID=1761780 RepID=UPI0008CE6EB2|nr:leucine-rich repeat protein [Butyrivibrio sp. ob235]SEL18004.1 Leucine rich repeat-containing protein [Butyrivibrio sp. ob235]